MTARTEVTVFSELDLIRDLRRRSSAAWQSQMGQMPPEGWSISPVDFAPLLAVFEPLALRPGNVLRAYQYREGESGHARVWALPEDAAFLAPDEGSPGEPPQPLEALPDPMEAIEGDGTPFSYLCASLFAREAASVGGFGHGAWWDTYTIIGQVPEAVWRWLESPPEEWRPSVTRAAGTVTVTMQACCNLGGERLVSLIDTYPEKGHTLRTRELDLAEGGEGVLP